MLLDIGKASPLAIGKTEENATIHIGDIERRSSVYILGKPGTGKSTFLLNNLIQDMRHGLSGFFLDPHGEAVSKAIAALPRGFDYRNILLINPTDNHFAFGVNPLFCSDISSRTSRREAYLKTYNVFKRLWEKDANWGLWLRVILENTLPVLIEKGYTLAEMPMFLTNRDFRKSLLTTVEYNDRAVDFWTYEFKEEQARPALVRIGSLLSNDYAREIVGQKETTIDFTNLTSSPGNFMLIRLSRMLDDETRHFIGTIITSELLHHIWQRKPDFTFCIYIDEFQHFATDQFADFILEGRKYGCAITLAHQERLGQFGENEKILGATMACANKVVFQCTPRDARELALEFAEKPTHTETRKIPQLVISKEPVWDTLHKGHPNARIQELAFIHFTPFYELIWKLRAELEEKYLIRMDFLDEAAESQIGASMERSQPNSIQIYGRLVSTTSFNRIQSTLGAALSARQDAQSVIFGIQLRKDALERTRQRIKRTNEFLTALMEGRQTLAPMQERVVDFIDDLWVSQDFGYGELMAPYAAIYLLYIRLLFGNPAIERHIPDILAAKYYRSQIEEIFEEEIQKRFAERALEWLRDCRQRTKTKSHEGIKWGRKARDEDIAHFKAVKFFPLDGLNGMRYEYRDQRSDYPPYIPSLPSRVLTDSEIGQLKDICSHELAGLIKAGKRDVFKMTSEISELCELLIEPENHVKVASGVYTEVAVNIATTQEMINRTMQEMTELPRFTAMAKAISEKDGKQEVIKVKIKTNPDPPIIQSSMLEAQITEFTNGTIGTRRDQVEQEISERRSAWRKQTSRKGNPPGDDKPPSAWC